MKLRGVVLALAACLALGPLVSSPLPVAGQAEQTPIVDKFGTSPVQGYTRWGNAGDQNNTLLLAHPEFIAGKTRDAGVRLTRENINWGSIENPAGTYGWLDMDIRLVNARAGGAEIIGTVAYSPTFHTNDGNFNTPPQTEAQLQAWENFFLAAARRYQGNIPDGPLAGQAVNLRIWQAWNSHDPTVWTIFNQPGEFDTYVRMLTRATRAVRAANPTATVLAFEADQIAYNKMIDAGALPHFDGASIANYAVLDNPGNPAPPIPEASSLTTTRIGSLQDLIRRKMPGKTIWVTQYGWPTLVPVGNLGVTEPEQAAYVIRSMLIQGVLPDVRAALWGAISDIVNNNHQIDTTDINLNLGLLLRVNCMRVSDTALRTSLAQDFSCNPKVSFPAYQAMTTALGRTIFTRALPFPQTSQPVVQENFETGQPEYRVGFNPNIQNGGLNTYQRTPAAARTGSFGAQLNYQWNAAAGSFTHLVPLTQVPGGSVPVPGSPTRFKLSARLTNPSQIGVQVALAFTDATGKQCQHTLGIINSTDWEELTVFLDAPPRKAGLLTCGGNPDTSVQFPIGFRGVIVAGDPQLANAAQGTVFLDDFTFEYGPTVFNYQFDDATNEVHAVWTLQGQVSTTFPTSGTTATARDKNNTVTNVPVQNGQVTVTATDHPLFVKIQKIGEPSCNAQPRVSVRVVRSGAGVLQATITANGTNNRVQALNIGPAPTARVSLNGQSVNGPVDLASTLPQNVVLNVTRAPGSATATVPIVVTDRCGTPWRTFVGGGVNAWGG